MGQLISVDAPVSGWDAFHSLDAAPPTSAIILENLIPAEGAVESRFGSIVYATLPGVTGPVDTVASYYTRNDEKLLAAAGGGMWDITGGGVQVGETGGVPESGPATNASAITELAPIGTFSNDRWQNANFKKLDEEGVLVLCNGTDPVQVYDGAALQPATFSGETGAGDNFLGSITYKGRMYYWHEDDNAFYYAQAGAYQGEMKAFDLGTFTKLGGKIKFLTSWTQQDAGDGKDDFFVAVFDTGELLVYQGDDPETVGFWDSVGRYFMAEPLSVRGVVQYGADTIVMTRDGYVSLASIIQQGRTSDVPQFSRLIHNAIKKQTAFSGDVFGWDVQLFQKQGLFVFNAPINATTVQQHVMNTTTQKWCKFVDLNVTCLEVHNERLFGGTPDGRVLALLESTADDGGPIYFKALPAYQYLGDNGKQKHMVAVQPLTTSYTYELMTIQGYADFAVPDIQPVPVPPDATFATWSIGAGNLPPPDPLGSFWDEAEWATDFTPFTFKGWQNVSAYGYAVTFLLSFAKLNESMTWRSTNVRFYTSEAQ